MKFIKILYPKGPFEMGETPVTQAQWKKVMGNNPSTFVKNQAPVETVSYNDCQDFIKKLNKSQKKYTYRLPTEEEWLFAAGPDPEKFDDYAWYYDNSNMQTHAVKLKKLNRYGLYDMFGNVWEWTDTLYDNDHDWKVIRGGSWHLVARSLRSASRDCGTPGLRGGDLGFRLVRTKKLKDNLPKENNKNILKALDYLKQAIELLEAK